MTDLDATREWYRELGLDEVRPGALATRDGGVQLHHETSIRFHIEALGSEMSDPLPGLGGFLRCNDVHHNLALQSAPAPAPFLLEREEVITAMAEG